MVFCGVFANATFHSRKIPGEWHRVFFVFLCILKSRMKQEHLGWDGVHRWLLLRLKKNMRPK
jgi:hypothetical protein